MNFDLSQLSFGEKLWLWRMREPSNLSISAGRRTGIMTHVEAAKSLGISTKNYAKLEGDDLTCKISLSVDTWENISFQANSKSLTLNVHEQCLLARKRSGKIIADIALELGISSTRFYVIEPECDERLIALWQKMGFIFHSSKNNA